MAILCGVDIVYIPNINRMLGNDHMLEKFFHGSELNDTSPDHLAGIIAAKEAFFKALGTIPKFHEVEVSYEESGKPKFVLSPGYKDFKSYDVSISHDNQYAIAFVVIEK